MESMLLAKPQDKYALVSYSFRYPSHLKLEITDPHNLPVEIRVNIKDKRMRDGCYFLGLIPVWSQGVSRHSPGFQLRNACKSHCWDLSHYHMDTSLLSFTLRAFSSVWLCMLVNRSLTCMFLCRVSHLMHKHSLFCGTFSTSQTKSTQCKSDSATLIPKSTNQSWGRHLQRHVFSSTEYGIFVFWNQFYVPCISGVPLKYRGSLSNSVNKALCLLPMTVTPLIFQDKRPQI